MMNAEPLVSVCMTAYNHAPYIGRAIEGVLSQRTHSCCIISCHICGYLLRTGSGSH